MSYIQGTNVEHIESHTEEEGGEEIIEHVKLGQIVTNYPDTGEGWVPEYSVEHYATISPAEWGLVPPEHEVTLERQQYLHDHVNHYWGAPRPE